MEVIGVYVPGVPRQEGVEGYLVVALTTGATGRDYAVYIGVARLEDATDEDQRAQAAEWVAHSGTKLTYAKALNYFPNLDEGRYRA